VSRSISRFLLNRAGLRAAQVEQADSDTITLIHIMGNRLQVLQNRRAAPPAGRGLHQHVAAPR